MPTDRVPKHKQRLATGNPEQQNVANKQAPHDAGAGGTNSREQGKTANAGAKGKERISEAGDKNKEEKID